MDPIFKKVEKPKNGRRLVISDIHGCSKTLKELLDKVGLSKSDQLFFLGDYIDHGPDSKGVMDFIRHLIEEKYMIYPLMGNHEADLLEYMNEDPYILEWHMKKGKYENMMDGTTVAQPYVDFIKSLPYYYDTGDFYLVHAGFNFFKEKPFEDKGDMLCLRRIEPDLALLNGHRIIHGHQPYYIEDITQKIKENSIVLPLDNGVPYIKKHKIYDYTRLGKLCCLNLDNMNLTLQKNVDMIS